MILAMLLASLLPFDLVISQPHPDCLVNPCTVITCDVWAFDPNRPGEPVEGGASVALHSAECTPAGPIATFHVVPGTDIIGYCVRQHFEDRSPTDCATQFGRHTGGDKEPPVRR